MIEYISERFARYIKQANEEETASIAVMKFALIGIFNTLFTVLLSLAIGLVTGKFIETIVVLFSFSFLRFFSGGLHLKSSLSCILISTFTMSVIPHVPVNNNWSLYLTYTSLILVIFLAPSNIKGFARIPEKYFPILKVISAIIVTSNLFINSPVLALSFFIQSVSLININHSK